LDAPNVEKVDVDVTQEHLMDINKYRFEKRIHPKMNSTCPTIPKFHAAFG